MGYIRKAFCQKENRIKFISLSIVLVMVIMLSFAVQIDEKKDYGDRKNQNNSGEVSANVTYKYNITNADYCIVFKDGKLYKTVAPTTTGVTNYEEIIDDNPIKEAITIGVDEDGVTPLLTINSLYFSTNITYPLYLSKTECIIPDTYAGSPDKDNTINAGCMLYIEGDATIEVEGDSKLELYDAGNSSGYNNGNLEAAYGIYCSGNLKIKDYNDNGSISIDYDELHYYHAGSINNYSVYCYGIFANNNMTVAIDVDVAITKDRFEEGKESDGDYYLVNCRGLSGIAVQNGDINIQKGNINIDSYAWIVYFGSTTQHGGDASLAQYRGLSVQERGNIYINEITNKDTKINISNNRKTEWLYGIYVNDGDVYNNGGEIILNNNEAVRAFASIDTGDLGLGINISGKQYETTGGIYIVSNDNGFYMESGKIDFRSTLEKTIYVFNFFGINSSGGVEINNSEIYMNGYGESYSVGVYSTTGAVYRNCDITLDLELKRSNNRCNKAASSASTYEYKTLINMIGGLWLNDTTNTKKINVMNCDLNIKLKRLYNQSEDDEKKFLSSSWEWGTPTKKNYTDKVFVTSADSEPLTAKDSVGTDEDVDLRLNLDKTNHKYIINGATVDGSSIVSEGSNLDLDTTEVANALDWNKCTYVDIVSLAKYYYKYYVSSKTMNKVSADGTETPVTSGSDDQMWTIDADGTLNLWRFNFTTMASYALLIVGDAKVNISSDNYIMSKYYNVLGTDKANHGIYATSNLTLSGDGTFTFKKIDVTGGGGSFTPIHVSGNLTVNGGTYNLSATGNKDSALNINGNLVVNAGTLNIGTNDIDLNTADMELVDSALVTDTGESKSIDITSSKYGICYIGSDTFKIKCRKGIIETTGTTRAIGVGDYITDSIKIDDSISTELDYKTALIETTKDAHDYPIVYDFDNYTYAKIGSVRNWFYTYKGTDKSMYKSWIDSSGNQVDEKINQAKASDGSWSISDEGVLTLNNFNFETAASRGLVLEGTSTDVAIEGNVYITPFIYYNYYSGASNPVNDTTEYGLMVKSSNSNFSGSGTLTVSKKKYIESSNLTSNNNYNAFYSTTGNVTVDSGTYNLTGEKSAIQQESGEVNISNGTLNLSSTSDNIVYSTGKFNITGGTVDLSTTGSSVTGINSTNLAIKNANVKIRGTNKAINNTGTLDIYESIQGAPKCDGHTDPVGTVEVLDINKNLSTTYAAYKYFYMIPVVISVDVTWDDMNFVGTETWSTTDLEYTCTFDGSKSVNVSNNSNVPVKVSMSYNQNTSTDVKDKNDNYIVGTLTKTNDTIETGVKNWSSDLTLGSFSYTGRSYTKDYGVTPQLVGNVTVTLSDYMSE